jgi:hypothetical protein
MGCCGKIKDAMETINVGGKGRAVLNITRGNISYFIEKLFNVNDFKLLELLKCADTDRRLEICHKCEKKTWLTRQNFEIFLRRHWKEVLKNFEDLSKLPELPKEEYEKNKYLFCMLCKCPLSRKTRIKSEKCELGKW